MAISIGANSPTSIIEIGLADYTGSGTRIGTGDLAVTVPSLSGSGVRYSTGSSAWTLASVELDVIAVHPVRRNASAALQIEPELTGSGRYRIISTGANLINTVTLSGTSSKVIDIDGDTLGNILTNLVGAGEVDTGSGTIRLGSGNLIHLHEIDGAGNRISTADDDLEVQVTLTGTGTIIFESIVSDPLDSLDHVAPTLVGSGFTETPGAGRRYRALVIG